MIGFRVQGLGCVFSWWGGGSVFVGFRPVLGFGFRVDPLQGLRLLLMACTSAVGRVRGWIFTVTTATPKKRPKISLNPKPQRSPKSDPNLEIREPGPKRLKSGQVDMLGVEATTWANGLLRRCAACSFVLCLEPWGLRLGFRVWGLGFRV